MASNAVDSRGDHRMEARARQSYSEPRVGIAAVVIGTPLRYLVSAGVTQSSVSFTMPSQRLAAPSSHRVYRGGATERAIENPGCPIRTVAPDAVSTESLCPRRLGCLAARVWKLWT